MTRRAPYALLLFALLASVGSTWGAGAVPRPPRGIVAAPSPRQWMGMAYDATRNVVVLFGGVEADGSRLGDTWTWDGVWTQQNPPSSPRPRGGVGMAYDHARGRVVLFGGSRGFGTSNETWTWDGTTWTQQHPAHSPSARSDVVMAYDQARGRVVLFGVDAVTIRARAWPGRGSGTERTGPDSREPNPRLARPRAWPTTRSTGSSSCLVEPTA